MFSGERQMPLEDMIFHMWWLTLTVARRMARWRAGGVGMVVFDYILMFMTLGLRAIKDVDLTDDEKRRL